jgi:hypothetical protein
MAEIAGGASVGESDRERIGRVVVVVVSVAGEKEELVVVTVVVGVP